MSKIIGWFRSAASILSDILTTKGDIITFSTTPIRLGVGANNTVLTADSTQASGLKWATSTDTTMILAINPTANLVDNIGAKFHGISFIGITATESPCQTPFPAGTLNNWRVKADTNAATNSNTLTLRENGVSTALVITITAGGTGTFSDLTNSNVNAAGDLMSVATTQAVTGNITGGGWSLVFTPT